MSDRVTLTLIAAFDVGLSTGWALCRDGRIVESGVQKFELARGESPGMRFLRFRRFLDLLLGPQVPQVVAFERAAYSRGGYAVELHLNFTGRLEEWAAEHKVESLPVHTGTLRKWACGSGRADKATLRQRASDVVSQPVGEDEAMAILVALWAWEEAGGA